MSDGRMEVATVYAPTLVPPTELAADARAVAAITGTFFAPSDGTPVADVLVDGRLESRGNRGSGVAIDGNGRPMIFDRPFRRRFRWDGFRYGLRGAVRLVTKGKVNPNPRAQAFRDPRIWGRAARTGVGITRHGKFVLMSTGANVTLSTFGRAMVAAGVREGVSLDGGGSSCLIYKGSSVVKTARRLSNMVVIRPPQATALTGNGEVERDGQDQIDP